MNLLEKGCFGEKCDVPESPIIDGHGLAEVEAENLQEHQEPEKVLVVPRPSILLKKSTTKSTDGDEPVAATTRSVVEVPQDSEDPAVALKSIYHHRVCMHMCHIWYEPTVHWIEL